MDTRLSSTVCILLVAISSACSAHLSLNSICKKMHNSVRQSSLPFDQLRHVSSADCNGLVIGVLSGCSIRYWQATS